MPHEILGELICLGVEIASEDKKGGCGCIFAIVLIIGGIIAYYYFG